MLWTHSRTQVYYDTNEMLLSVFIWSAQCVHVCVFELLQGGLSSMSHQQTFSICTPDVYKLVTQLTMSNHKGKLVLL